MSEERHGGDGDEWGWGDEDEDHGVKVHDGREDDADWAGRVGEEDWTGRRMEMRKGELEQAWKGAGVAV